MTAAARQATPTLHREWANRVRVRSEVVIAVIFVVQVELTLFVRHEDLRQEFVHEVNEFGAAFHSFFVRLQIQYTHELSKIASAVPRDRCPPVVGSRRAAVAIANGGAYTVRADLLRLLLGHR
jgi:hypothetical protein